MSLKNTDRDIFKLVGHEKKRQQDQLQMIPSENYVSKAVQDAVGSVVVNKYSEGQPNKRYYQGNEYIDKIEILTKQRALKAFKLDPKMWSVNVQAATGSIANLAVYFALLDPGDKILSMNLYDGGHLSHGWKISKNKPVNMASKIFKSVFYGVDQKTRILNYDQIEKLAKKERPKIIISGGTAYPREINHKKLGAIAKSVGAYYLADIAHEAGLVIAGVNKSPFRYADIITMTTRKTLRGPIGALIFSGKNLSEKIDRAVFPGLQGGPLNHSIAGISVALKESSQPQFKKYSKQTVVNAKTLAKELEKYGFDLVSGGTDKHLILIDLNNKGIDGWYAAWALEYAGIITNRSTVPFDSRSPYYPSGIRLGTPAITTRGMKQKEMILISKYISEAIDIANSELEKGLKNKSRKEFKSSMSKNSKTRKIEKEVKSLCKKFPIY